MANPHTKTPIPHAAALLLALLIGLLTPSLAHAQCNGRWLTSPEQTPLGLNGSVFALAVMPNGDLIAGGTFTGTAAVTTRRIARWNGSSWAPLGSGMSGTFPGVRALAVMPNGDLIAGGEFSTAGGVAANNIARWNGSSWTPLGTGLRNGHPAYPARVDALAVMPNGDLIAGGTFYTAGDVSASRIARWNGTSWAPLGSGVTGGLASSGVNALAVMPNGDLIAGGEFTTIGGVAASRIARWNGSAWTPLGTGMSSSSVNTSTRVHSLAVLPNGDLVASGTFSTAGGVAASNIARWNGSSWAPLGSGMNNLVWALTVLSNGDLVAGGFYTTAGGVEANRIARWNGSSWAPMGSGLSGGNVYAIASMPNGDIVVGGQFNSSNGLVTNRTARWNGSTWDSLEPMGLNSNVYSLAVLPSGDLVAGGTFTTAGRLEAKSLALWDGSSWSPIGSGMSGTVRDLAVLPSGDLVACGSFTTPGCAAANRISRWNGSSWASLGSGLNDIVHALAVLPGGDLIAGGQFNTAGGLSAKCIARWDPSIADTCSPSSVGNAQQNARWGGSSWAPLGSGMTAPLYAPVYTLAVLPNGDAVAGGNFTSAGGVTVNRIARWNGSSWAPLGSGFNDWVYALAVMPNGDFIAGGNFTTAGGVAANRIARWNGSSWAPLGSGMNGSVLALAVLPSGDLVAGSRFSTSGGVTTNEIVRWDGASWTPLGSVMSGHGNIPPVVRAFAVLPSGELVVGGDFIRAGGLPSAYFARWTDTGIPWVARQPLAQSLEGGETLSLSATCASGYDFNGPVSFQWQRNGVPITDGPGGASPGGGTVSGASGSLPSPTNNPTATLTIAEAQLSDTGEYTIIFTNSCGSITSAAASISVEAYCPADFNQDGGVDGGDVEAFYLAWEAADPSADVNRDGGVDGNDVEVFFIAWQAGGCD